jgi:uncharacterized protein YjbI with pentapeptide repeats
MSEQQSPLAISDAYGQPISAERQAELQAILDAWNAPGADHGERRGPFDGTRLGGAEVAWLASQSGRDEIERVPNLHLEGADLREAQLARVYLGAVHLEGADLHGAHLEETHLGAAHLEEADLREAHLERADFVEVHLEGANLRNAHLEGAHLGSAHLEGAELRWANLEGADLALAYLEQATLREAHLERVTLFGAYAERADFSYAHLEGANLYGAHLEGAILGAAHLEGATFLGAHLKRADLHDAHLEGAILQDADLEWADLGAVNLEGADLHNAHLERANLRNVHLERADLGAAHLEGADLHGVHLEGANLRNAHLEGANLRDATLDGKTDLAGALVAKSPTLSERLLNWVPFVRRTTSTSLGDMRWGGVGTVDLTAVQWESVLRLGDEREAGRNDSAEKHEAVVRAYRQLAAQLRAQGMAEVADRFALRAQIRQRGVLLRRLRLGPYLFSWFLAILAGYGYRPSRTILWYLAVVLGFAFAYVHFGQIAGHPFDPDEALVFSVTSFHGRGFFPGTFSLKDLVVKLAAGEAVIGLLIEISFIATFTQRFFGAK